MSIREQVDEVLKFWPTNTTADPHGAFSALYQALDLLVDKVMELDNPQAIEEIAPTLPSFKVVNKKKKAKDMLSEVESVQGGN